MLLLGGKPWFLAGGTAVVLVLATLAPSLSTDFRGRSFFGVTEVRHDGDDADPDERHDRPRDAVARCRAPRHAHDLLRHAAARPATSSRSAPTARRWTRSASGRRAGRRHARGLHGRVDDDDLLRDRSRRHPRRPGPGFFTYLSDAPGAPDIVEGDARLSLAKEPDDRFDLLVLDAFSSDSIPIHLLTAEAITDELRTLTPDGVIASTSRTATTTSRRRSRRPLPSSGWTTMERASSAADTAGDESLRPVAGWRPRASRDRIAALPRAWLARRDPRRADRSRTTTPTCCRTCTWP